MTTQGDELYRDESGQYFFYKPGPVNNHGEHYDPTNERLPLDLGKTIDTLLQQAELRGKIEGIQMADSTLRFENITLHPVQTTSLRNLVDQLEAQLKTLTLSKEEK